MFEKKSEPQDIFESVSPPANLPVGITLENNAPVIPSAPAVGKIIADRHINTGGHVMKTVLIVLIAFAALGTVAVFAYRYMLPADQDTDNPSQVVPAGKDDDDLTDPDGKGPNEPASVPTVRVMIDTDGDGLTNDEEQAAGTDVTKPDTDSDLLGDREEVQVYDTDPLRVDTDGDSFTDGQEVRAGYNPNGPGKILELPSE